MKKIIAVASGKGGVGKSTVAVNLAVALANQPMDGKDKLKVALVDVDFYGPSVPLLMGGGEVSADSEQRLNPASKFGVNYISIAFFLQSDDDPVIWRGPMFGKAIEQLFNDVNWGDIDICIVDMPPGTGDAQLSLSQIVSLDGALIVTTPQEVALTDVRRAINMFRKVNVEVVGVVENMSGFVTPSGERFDIFGTGGGESLARRYDLECLSSIPLDMKIREGGDSGTPIALDVTSEVGKLYSELASKLLRKIESSDTTELKPELKVVN